MLLVSIFIILLVLFVIYLVKWMEFDDHNPRHYITGAIITAVIMNFIMVGNYFSSIKGVLDIELEYETNLTNIKTVAENLNKEATINYSDTDMILDAANHNQSSITSKMYRSYLIEINNFNSNIVKMKYHRDFPWIFGLLAPLPEHIKPIKINFDEKK